MTFAHYELLFASWMVKQSYLPDLLTCSCSLYKMVLMGKWLDAMSWGTMYRRIYFGFKCNKLTQQPISSRFMCKLVLTSFWCRLLLRILVMWWQLVRAPKNKIYLTPHLLSVSIQLVGRGTKEEYSCNWSPQSPFWEFKCMRGHFFSYW